MADIPVLVAGDTVVDAYPEGRLALGGDAVALHPGGSGANAAVGLARLFGAPHFHTVLAGDRLAAELAANFRRAGVGDDLFRRVDGETPVAFLDRPEGDLAWTVYHRPATLALDADLVPDAVLSSVSAVHLSAITLGHERGRAATVELARRARERGATVAVDCNGRANMWDGPAGFRDALGELLSRADVAFASAGDLAVAGVEGDRDRLLSFLHDRGVERAFLTRGADGAVASDGARTVAHAGYEVDAVNPAGAGDAFAAGVVGALAASDGETLSDLLAVGNAAGALATTGDDPTAPLSPDRLRALAGEAVPAGVLDS
ncbi:MAG: PfkB family carbohydrate kinase [Halobacteriales archaeon]